MSLQGLRWMAGSQLAKGAWESDFGPIKVTAIGLLAILGWGLTPDSPEFPLHLFHASATLSRQCPVILPSP